MTKPTDLLNKVQAMLIEFANANNINLRDEFKTVDDFKSFVIAFTFKSLTEIGMAANDAYDMIFGAGEFDALASRIWNAVQ